MTMAEKTLAEEIITMIKTEANNNPAPVTCTVTKSYSDAHVDINVNDGILNYIPSNITGNVGDTGIVVFIDGDINNPFVILSSQSNTDEAMIMALGLGLFHIDTSGHLIVELPNNMENIFDIDNSGHLTVTLPSGASNDYTLKTDGRLYYNR